jgi:hypothetical protein
VICGLLSAFLSVRELFRRFFITDRLKPTLHTAFPHSLIPSFVRVVSCSIVLILFFTGWGGTGHRIINLNAPGSLPATMAGFLARATMLADSASNADTRKSKDPTESPKHYIDIDDYPEFATRTVSHSLDSLILKYGSTRVYGNGILPWATVAAVDSLTAQMHRGDWTRVWSTAADLGHYVADAHQPLHCTVNYDGKLTGNNGIHSRHESSMINNYQQSIFVNPSVASYVANPMDSVFSYIYWSQTYVDSILAADTYAKQVAGSTTGTVYYAALWDQTGTFTKLLIQRASERLANLLYTAWINAGQPIVPAVTGVDDFASTPFSVTLDEVYPNPFNPTTVVSYRVAGVRSQESPQEVGGQAEVSLKIYDLLGREVAMLAEGEQVPGVHSVVFDGKDFPSGVYFIRLEAVSSRSQGRPFVQTKKVILLK